MNKYNQCFTLSLLNTKQLQVYFSLHLCNIRLKYSKRLHGLGEEQQKGEV